MKINIFLSVMNDIVVNCVINDDFDMLNNGLINSVNDKVNDSFLNRVQY